jgi:hypothetical protein
MLLMILFDIVDRNRSEPLCMYVRMSQEELYYVGQPLPVDVYHHNKFSHISSSCCCFIFLVDSMEQIQISSMQKSLQEVRRKFSQSSKFLLLLFHTIVCTHCLVANNIQNHQHASGEDPPM